MQAADLYHTASRVIAPRKPLTVSQWADANRVLSSKTSQQPGKWITDRNPLLREPMDCMSVRSEVQEIVCIFPIQFGKSEFETNVIGYSMCENPGPIMVVLPGEVSLDKFTNQKLNPLLDETPACTEVLSSTSSRNARNTQGFKDFAGGQLYLEHAGNEKRLKSTSAQIVLVDEFDSFAASLKTGDDPDALLDGRQSAFPSTRKRASVGTPETLGTSRLEEKWEKSDQRLPHVPCPHCGHMHPLTFDGFHWSLGADGRVTRAWCTCPECGADIDEHHKDRMTSRVQWVPRFPGRKLRGYRANFLYYRFALGPRWAEMAQAWVDAQNDPAKLKTFTCDRRAEAYEDATLRNIRHNAIADRAEPYPLRTAPMGALCVTAGIDTQDNRLAVQLVGWGPAGGQGNLKFWTLDYVELPGDPSEAAVWNALTEYLARPIQHASGAVLRVEASAQDIAGHRREYVKHYARSRRARRFMAVFGATANNAPALGKPKAEDVTVEGKTDHAGVLVYQVGTVHIKHWLYSLLSSDAAQEPENRKTHFSDQLPPEYFTGLVGEVYNPAKNRFENKRGARNEPLDTFVYAYAAIHHPEVRLHRFTRADWDLARKNLLLAQNLPDTAIPAFGPATPAAPAAGAVSASSAQADQPLAEHAPVNIIANSAAQGAGGRRILNRGFSR